MDNNLFLSMKETHISVNVRELCLICVKNAILIFFYAGVISLFFFFVQVTRTTDMTGAACKCRPMNKICLKKVHISDGITLSQQGRSHYF